MASDAHIHLIDIEKALKDLWDKNPNEKKIKACLFNLIVYVADERRIEYFKDIISKIVLSFPCRILFIEREVDETKSYLDISVTTEMHAAEDTEIGCDQILVKVSSDLLERVPFIITPHLVPDLPVYLLWGKDPTVETDLLPYFQTIASKIIFDTECARDLQKFSRLILHEWIPLNIDMTDVHWALISPWRRVAAQVFNSPERIRQLTYANLVKIVYNASNAELARHLKTQAIYFQAWLAAQLGWQMEHLEYETHLTRLHYVKGQKKITVELTRGENINLQCGSILSVQVETEDLMIFHLVRNEALRKVVVHITAGDQCLLPFTLPLSNLKSSFNFMREIFYERTGEQYRHVLKKLAETDWRPIYGK